MEFDTEEGVFYNYSLQKDVVAGKVKLARSIERKMNSYEEICMIGSIVEVKWTEDDLEGTEWSAGKYTNFLLSSNDEQSIPTFALFELYVVKASFTQE